MPSAPEFPLKIFYDGSCSVCAREMAVYRRDTTSGQLEFVDISSPSFDPLPYGITLESFMSELHVIDRLGNVYRGVEGFWAIWQAFPASNLYGILGILVSHPLTAPVARTLYLAFARIRRYLPKNRAECTDGVCRLRK